MFLTLNCFKLIYLLKTYWSPGTPGCQLCCLVDLCRNKHLFFALNTSASSAARQLHRNYTVQGHSLGLYSNCGDAACWDGKERFSSSPLRLWLMRPGLHLLLSTVLASHCLLLLHLCTYFSWAMHGCLRLDPGTIWEGLSLSIHLFVGYLLCFLVVFSHHKFTNT